MTFSTDWGNTYQIRVSCGYDIRGVQQFQSKTWKPDEGMTPKQIEKELNRQAILFEEECKKGQVTASVKFETLAEEWFEQYAKIQLRSTTYTRLRQLTKRVYPAIGHLRMDKITARIIQNFITDLAMNGKSFKTGKPISSKTVVHHLSFISDVFNYAIRMDMLTDNPCRRVIPPKAKAAEKDYYTLEEVEKLFELLRGEPLKYQVFFNLAIYSGFRRGELLGLEWKDIEWETGVISVRRTSNYTAEKGIYTDTTKTKKSLRSLKFPQLIMNLLKDFRIEQLGEAERIGSKWIDNDRLFVKWNGEPMNPQTPYGWFREFCKHNGFRFCDIHSFRHLKASLLINAGIDAVAVSGALGHAHTSTTLNIYSHMFQQAQARVSNAVSEALDFHKDKDKNDEKTAKKILPETKNFGEIHSTFKNNGQTMDSGNFRKK